MRRESFSRVSEDLNRYFFPKAHRAKQMGLSEIQEAFARKTDIEDTLALLMTTFLSALTLMAVDDLVLDADREYGLFVIAATVLTRGLYTLWLEDKWKSID